MSAFDPLRTLHLTVLEDVNMKAAGISIIFMSVIFFPTLWIGLIKDSPSAILGLWDVYVIFLFLPVVAGLTLITLGVRQGRRRIDSSH